MICSKKSNLKKVILQNIHPTCKVKKKEIEEDKAPRGRNIRGR
jgi:hypothetical protein